MRTSLTSSVCRTAMKQQPKQRFQTRGDICAVADFHGLSVVCRRSHFLGSAPFGLKKSRCRIQKALAACVRATTRGQHLRGQARAPQPCGTEPEDSQENCRWVELSIRRVSTHGFLLHGQPTRYLRNRIRIPLNPLGNIFLTCLLFSTENDLHLGSGCH